MATSSHLPSVAPVPLDEVLSSAILLHWNDLMPEEANSQIQLEYHLQSAGSVEFVKVWGATVRGHWDLICSYWIPSAASGQSGLRFANGHKSDGLNSMLGSIMQHLDLFQVRKAPGGDRMIQLSSPSDKERTSALATIGVFRDQLSR